MPKAKVRRFEPTVAELFKAYPGCRQRIEQMGWMPFYERLNGYSMNVTRAFAETFNGHEARVGKLVIQVSENFIAECIGVPCEGERWFKNIPIKGLDWHEFLLPGYDNPDWTKGVPREWIIEEWRDVLFVTQQCITCEGRYAVTLLYHLRFLLHFKGTQRMNLPFYLWKSLTEMATRVQTHPKDASTSLFHHSLIKLLVEGEVRKKNWTWAQFLFWSGFELNPSAPNLTPASQSKKIRITPLRKLKSSTKEDENSRKSPQATQTEALGLAKNDSIKTHRTSRKTGRKMSSQVEEGTSKTDQELEIVQNAPKRPRTRSLTGKNLIPPIANRVEKEAVPPMEEEPSLQYTLEKSTKIKRKSTEVKEFEQAEEKSRESSSDKESSKKKTRKELKREILECKNDNIFLQESYDRLSEKYDELDQRYRVLFIKAKEWYFKLAKSEEQNESLKKKIRHLKHEPVASSSSKPDMLAQEAEHVQF